MERQYYLVFNIRTEETTPIVCDGYQVSDGGWVEFYTGAMDFVSMAVHGSNFWFMQISKEEFDTAEAQVDPEDFLD